MPPRSVSTAWRISSVTCASSAALRRIVALLFVWRVDEPRLYVRGVNGRLLACAHDPQGSARGRARGNKVRSIVPRPTGQRSTISEAADPEPALLQRAALGREERAMPQSTLRIIYNASAAYWKR